MLGEWKMNKEKLIKLSEKVWAPFLLAFLIAPLLGNLLFPFVGFFVALGAIYLLWKNKHFKMFLRIPLYGVFFFAAISVLALAGTANDESEEEVAAVVEEEAPEGNVNEALEDNANEEEVQKEEETEEKATEYFVDENFRMEDDIVILEGETNLENGTVLSFEVKNLDELDNFIEGDITVDEGAFHEEVDISEFTNGEILAWMGLTMNNQNEEVEEVYGGFEGKNVSGDLSGDDYGMLYSFEELFNRLEPIEPTVVSGSGDSATDTFDLEAGMTIIEASHSGERNFIAELKDENGNSVELIVNDIGNYSGQKAVTVPTADAYYLEIDADGSWDFEIDQVIPNSGESMPGTIESSGDDVVFVKMESGNHRLSFTHSGERNFIVMLNNQNLLVNDIGSYEGNQTQQVDNDGIYMFNVEADGDWSITVE